MISVRLSELINNFIIFFVSVPVNAYEVVRGVVVVGRLVEAEVASVARRLRAVNPRERTKL